MISCHKELCSLSFPLDHNKNTNCSNILPQISLRCVCCHSGIHAHSCSCARCISADMIFNVPTLLNIQFWCCFPLSLRAPFHLYLLFFPINHLGLRSAQVHTHRDPWKTLHVTSMSFEHLPVGTDINNETGVKAAALCTFMRHARFHNVKNLSLDFHCTKIKK